MKVTQIICKNCNNAFTAKRRDALYCSNACRQNGYLEHLSALEETAIALKQNSRKATDYLIFLLNQTLNFAKTGIVTKNEIDDMLWKIEEANELFKDLSDHTQVKNGIKILCNTLRERMEREKISDLQITPIKSHLITVIETLFKSVKRLI